MLQVLCYWYYCDLNCISYCDMFANKVWPEFPFLVLETETDIPAKKQMMLPDTVGVHSKLKAEQRDKDLAKLCSRSTAVSDHCYRITQVPKQS